MKSPIYAIKTALARRIDRFMLKHFGVNGWIYHVKNNIPVSAWYEKIIRKEQLRRQNAIKRTVDVLFLCMFATAMIAFGYVIGTKTVHSEPFKAPVTTECAVTVESTNDAIKYGPTLPQRRPQGFKRTVVAYNSAANQTDATPCLSADGSNICQLYIDGENVCAANFVKLGTLLEVEGLGTCVVHDRMNARFPNSVDWFMGDDIGAAIQFGKQTLNVYAK